MTSTGSPSTRVTASAVAASSLAVTCGMAPVFLIGGLAPFIAVDFPLPAGPLGLMVGAFFAISAIGSWCAGVIPGGRAPAHALRLGVLASAASALLIAMAAGNWVHLAVWCLFAGAVNGAIQPAANMLLLDTLVQGRIGRALGFKQSAGPLAAMLVGLIIPTIAATVGWRWALGLVPALAVVVLAATAGAQATPAKSKASPSGRARRSGVWMLGLGAGCGAGASVATTSFLVVTAGERGMAPSGVGLALTAIGLLNILVLLYSGILADRRPEFINPSSLAIMLGIGVFGYLLGAVSPAPSSLVAGALLAVAVGHGWHVLLHLSAISGRFGDTRNATGSVMAGVFAGCSAVPVMYGTILTTFGDRAAWAALTAMALVGTAAFTGAASRAR